MSKDINYNIPTTWRWACGRPTMRDQEQASKSGRTGGASFPKKIAQWTRCNQRKKKSEYDLHLCPLCCVLIWHATVMPLAPYRLKRKQRHSELGLRSCLLSYVLVWYVTVMPLAHYRSKKKVQWARSVLMLTEWQAMPLSCYWHITGKKKKYSGLDLYSCSLSGRLCHCHAIGTFQ